MKRGILFLIFWLTVVTAVVYTVADMELEFPPFTGVLFGNLDLNGNCIVDTDDNQVCIDDDVCAPSYYLGDCDSGLYESSDDLLDFTIAGTDYFQMQSGLILLKNAGGTPVIVLDSGSGEVQLSGAYLDMFGNPIQDDSQDHVEFEDDIRLESEDDIENSAQGHVELISEIDQTELMRETLRSDNSPGNLDTSDYITRASEVAGGYVLREQRDLVGNYSVESASEFYQLDGGVLTLIQTDTPGYVDFNGRDIRTTGYISAALDTIDVTATPKTMLGTECYGSMYVCANSGGVVINCLAAVDEMNFAAKNKRTYTGVGDTITVAPNGSERIIKPDGTILGAGVSLVITPNGTGELIRGVFICDENGYWTMTDYVGTLSP